MIAEDIRANYACKVCGNIPDEEGTLTHGRGCYILSEKGGGKEDIEMPQQPAQVPFAGGLAVSSKIPPLHLIPTLALECLANRFQKGIERKGDKSWNAISTNQSILTNREFAIERTAHVIQHAMKLRDKLLSGEDLLGDDDDAGAIMWAGAFFACVGAALTK